MTKNGFRALAAMIRPGRDGSAGGRRRIGGSAWRRVGGAGREARVERVGGWRVGVYARERVRLLFWDRMVRHESLPR